MQKKKKLNNQPSQNEMGELEKLFNLNELDTLERKAKELISKYSKVANLYNILGIVLQRKKKFDEAIFNFNKAIDIQSNFHLAYNNLGNVLFIKKKFDEAINNYKKTIKINPNYAEAYNNLGNALSELGKFEEAISNQRYAIKLNPNIPQFYNNLGSSLTESGRFEEAVSNHQKALKINPNYAEAYSDLGTALQGLGKYEEAIANYQLSIKLNPKHKEAIKNESMVRLTLGDFEIGWKKYEARLEENIRIPMVYGNERKWDGNYLKGTLLVWGEQGIGDHIIFSSMLFDLKNYAKNILLQIDKRLENLLERYFKKINFLNIKIISAEKKFTGNFDKHIAIGSLGQYLRKSRASFKTTPKKYLISSAIKENEYKKKFLNNNKFKIGISWKTLNKMQQYRNIDLKKMLPILSNPNCDFVSLQFGKFDDELKYIKSKFGINIKSIDKINNYHDIDELAALINCLDLVITIQNSTAHLAGALGKNTWLMLVNNARWHWLKNETKSIWYPSIKIYRQEKNSNWNSVINNIFNDLKSFINQNKK